MAQWSRNCKIWVPWWITLPCPCDNFSVRTKRERQVQKEKSVKLSFFSFLEQHGVDTAPFHSLEPGQGAGRSALLRSCKDHRLSQPAGLVLSLSALLPWHGDFVTSSTLLCSQPGTTWERKCGCLHLPKSFSFLHSPSLGDGHTTEASQRSCSPPVAA